MTNENLKRLLKIAAKYEFTDLMYWNPSLDFYINCNDMFAWGCADLESISSDSDLDLLEDSCKDAHELNADFAYQGAYLYICRRRKMRPQGAFYKHIEAEFHPLIDACGPFRPSQFGNPVASGSEDK